jgi:hypothetical protein
VRVAHVLISAAQLRFARCPVAPTECSHMPVFFFGLPLNYMQCQLVLPQC